MTSIPNSYVGLVPSSIYVESPPNGANTCASVEEMALLTMMNQGHLNVRTTLSTLGSRTLFNRVHTNPILRVQLVKEILFAKAKEAANEINGGFVAARSLLIIAKREAKVDLPSARETLAFAKFNAREIRDSHLKDTALLAIAKEQTKIDLEGAKETASEIEIFYLRDTALLAIEIEQEKAVRSLLRIAKREAKVDLPCARETLALAKIKAREIQNSYRKDTALLAIAIEQVKLDLEGAKETASEIQRSFTKDTVLGAIAMQEAKVDPMGAKETASEIQSFSYRNCVLNTIDVIESSETYKRNLKALGEEIKKIKGFDPYKPEPLGQIEVEEAELDLLGTIEEDEAELDLMGTHEPFTFRLYAPFAFSVKERLLMRIAVKDVHRAFYLLNICIPGIRSLDKVRIITDLTRVANASNIKNFPIGRALTSKAQKIEPTSIPNKEIPLIKKQITLIKVASVALLVIATTAAAFALFILTAPTIAVIVTTGLVSASALGIYLIFKNAIRARSAYKFIS